MKKYLPVILLVVGLLVVVGAIIFVRGRDKSDDEVIDVEEAAPEISLGQRPIASLTPSDDGHWLKLEIKKIVIDAESMDYELLYKLPDGRTQGVPGNIKLEGQDSIERDLLMGSESSGKFRYDEGVENGTLTLRFRNEKGKLIAKFSTDLHLQSDTDELNSVDGVFAYKFDKEPRGGFFVTMETFGIEKALPGSLDKGPYGIFTSSGTTLSGEVELSSSKVYRWGGKDWQELEDKESSDIGVFVGIK